MDSLVRGGIALEHNYVQPICTPTRSALMTGYYPIHTGRQVSQTIQWFTFEYILGNYNMI